MGTVLSAFVYSLKFLNTRKNPATHDELEALANRPDIVRDDYMTELEALQAREMNETGTM